MEFGRRLTEMTQAICRGDGPAAAACFTPDGVYHDVFYGSFTGADIARMVERFFHRDGEAFLWELHDPVESGGIGYARYTFSYTSRLQGHVGRRAVFEGVALCRMQDGLISSYHEVANAMTGLALIGFDEISIARFAAKQAEALRADPARAEHFDPA